MSCCVTLRRQLSATDGPGPIMGTWDYKWAIGTRIRVAFQGLPSPDPEFDAAKRIIQDVAARWNNVAAIGFVFLDQDFPAPSVIQGERHPQRRSDVSSEPWRDYDVLVSLEPLPLTLVDPLAEHPEPRRIFLPYSELGTYARRLDFGTPTMFIGPMPSKSGGLADYYREPRAQAMVLHEFGHALGLAHEHQSPNARAALQLTADDYDLDKARLLMIRRLGVPESELPEIKRDKDTGEIKANDPTALFLRSHLGLTWPGNQRFSDWRQYSEKRLDSVMAVPYHGCALKSESASRCGISCCNCNCDDRCHDYETALRGEPTDADRAFLRLMYPAD